MDAEGVGDAAATALTARIFADVREAGDEPGAAHVSTQPVAPGLEGKAEAEAEVRAQQVGRPAT